MNRFRDRATLAGALCAVTALCLLSAAPAGAGSLVPRGNKVFFGTSDTGDSADFGQFSSALRKHPALIQTFRTWGSDFPESIERWQAARARPVLHINTADSNDGHELISPRGLPAFDRLGEVGAPGAEGLDQRRVLAQCAGELAEVGAVTGVAGPEEDLVAARHQRACAGRRGTEQAERGHGAERAGQSRPVPEAVHLRGGHGGKRGRLGRKDDSGGVIEMALDLSLIHISEPTRRTPI